LPEVKLHKKLLVIHHSHTDIGYTNMQARIERWQINFIHQVLDNIEDNTNAGFKWNCESFWVVEKYLQQASKQDINKFIKAIRSKQIGISGSYLNFNELIDYDLLFKLINKAKTFGNSIGVRVDSAMTADINGFGWGYSQALYDNGVENLFTCIHEHHGNIPLDNRHLPFWWKTPKDDKILVWLGEHYHFGNELGLVPDAVSSYIIKDECDAEMIYSDHWNVAKIRIPRLFQQLENDGYEYDFLPVMASGLRTDNAPPNHKILNAIEKWNYTYGDQYFIEMVTLTEFFDILRSQIKDIPTYQGDWPDWWSDGTACAPEFTRTFRQSQRDLCYYKSLLIKYPDLISNDTRDVEYNLALYAEHTFGHADSVANPWHFMQHTISSRKKTYAVKAYESTQILIDDAHKQLGMSDLKCGIPLYYKVVNPFGSEIRGLVKLTVEHFEYHELKLDKGIKIIDRKSKNGYPYQIMDSPTGMEYVIYLRLNSAEICDLEIIPTGSGFSAQNRPSEDTCYLENDFIRIEWCEDGGIISWYDKSAGRELIDPDIPYKPYTPVYEVTPVSDNTQMCAVRGKMDKNRKGDNVVRSVGKLTGMQNSDFGKVYKKITLKYKMPGISHYELDLLAYNNEARVDITVKMHKDSVWEPENVYLPLPFRINKDISELWLAKTGAMIRPLKDQIPGTLIDYYSIQDGIALISENYGIAISTPDANLIHIGDLEFKKRNLNSPSVMPSCNQSIFSWLMTNYWETNFDADLGGFYEFRYSICCGDYLNDAEKALNLCRNNNIGLRCFRVG
jgi:Glycosyl hydrolases family 38 N-terminal domain